MSVIALDKLTAFATKVLVAAGADREQAVAVAEALVWADSVGRDTYGVWRLPVLCKRLSAGLFHCPCPLYADNRMKRAAFTEDEIAAKLLEAYHPGKETRARTIVLAGLSG